MPDLMGAKNKKSFWDFLFLTASGGWYSVLTDYNSPKWNRTKS